MKNADLETKTQDELQKLLLDNKKELFNLRFQQASATLTNSRRIREVRRMIARIFTYMNQLNKKAS